MKKENRKKYLIKNTAILAIGNIATKLISFFLVPLYTNVLTTEQYGIIDLLYTVCTVAYPIITLNISEAVLRFSMDKDANNSKIMSIANIIIAFSIIIGLLSFPVINLFDNYRQYSLLFYLYLITLGISQILLCNLKGKEQLIEYSIGNFIHMLLIGLLNILFLLVFKMGINGYFWAYIISNIVVSLYATIKGNVKDSIFAFSFDKKLFIEMTKYSVVLIPNSFMWWIMNASDRVMVTNILGAQANGIYAVSYKLPSMLTVITSIFTSAWIYSAVNEKDSSDKNEYTSSVFSLLVSVVLLISSGMIMMIKPFLKIYVSNDYYSSWQFTPYLIIGFSILTLASFLSSSYNVHKDSKGFLFSGTAGAIINVILNFLLIPSIGINGAAIATALSYTSVFIYRIFDTKKYVKVKIFTKEFIIGFLLLFIESLTVYLDSIIGQILLLIEFIIMCFIFRKELKLMLKNILKILKLKKGGNLNEK